MSPEKVQSSEIIQGSSLEKLSEKLITEFFRPPSAIGKSADLSVVVSPPKAKPPGGTIFNKLESFFCNSAKTLNVPLLCVAAIPLIAAAIPAALVAGGLAMIGGLIGAVASFAQGGKASEGALLGAIIAGGVGAGLILAVAALPMIIARTIVGGSLAGIGIGCAKLGGAADEGIKEWEKRFLITSFPLEIAITEWLVVAKGIAGEGIQDIRSPVATPGLD